MKRLELVSKEEDKDAEISILQDAFRACNYPEWSLKNRTREKKNAEQDQQSLAKICIPYNKGLSERIARTMKKFQIETIHKPTNTIKNLLCSKAKDKLHPYDKPGAIYSIKCKAHGNHYVGETGRAAKERLYEHRVITHKDAKRSHSLGDEDANPLSEPQGERRSQRGVQRKDYKAMNSGKGQLLTVGDTIVSEQFGTIQ